MHVRYCVYCSSGRGSYLPRFIKSDPYDDKDVRTYDSMLHSTLTKIIDERRLTSGQIKELLRTSEDADQESMVKLILEQEPALSEIFPNGNKVSLIKIAVALCYQKSAEMLLRSGAADVNSVGEILVLSESILHTLLKMYPSSWNERLFELAMEQGADLEARDYMENTVLDAAVAAGRVREVKMLLSKGVEVNTTNDYGETPLITAVLWKVENNYDEELLMLLLEHGADATAREIRGWNALHHVAAWKPTVADQPNWARVLIENGASVNDRSYLRSTGVYHHQPIHFAARSGNLETIKLFLDHGANVNSRADTMDCFPLYYASEYNWPTVVLTLLERGADVDQSTSEGLTALHIACSKQANKTIELLLFSGGADILAEDLQGRTPFSLMNVSSGDSNSSVQLMLRMLALKRTRMQPSIELKDERRIKDHSELWEYYRDCIEEVNRMKSTRFIGTCSLLDLITKCQCQIATPMRNREFESRFSQHINVFPKYAEYLLEAIDAARAYYSDLLQSEDLIDEVSYNIWPHMTVRKVARYVTGCGQCALREVVRASRGSSSA
ncbi:putative ankyrin repeat protein RF_0381 [Nasonia vitripennis]|uniref:Ankyrin repeat protein n=1 Tax=Nasonia vitripennis TaxID=7425 RepID=A0A7M7QM72_NASVI|nr:putative ankyrin repeat protein RF_0381 [Nasonia vitripennis]XP_031787703.1 putative ankyrin repeat protein RF_0381 [Nasonia vitripennis]XP_031787704.1 putative ankyrin repeat protein RF_0381 [Nasonia vitripennis]XP_031787705.1 putative ankyrin repeat protein RF_0381 [Nasonia vitripennis]XP_031787706.1 putative ankyrin repeat protein RF_0381 [Nasonia vitripennis]XP_031787707.1 putative ankyrin repeat protein RF_0381 [Nasonia vitripennis]XP_031787708.1 putative ankyrin repeat protein RF_038